jgi:hypothetical protein
MDATVDAPDDDEVVVEPTESSAMDRSVDDP